MRVGSLFSGIGGLDLGLERAGMTVAWQSEIDPYACRVLAKHWPHVPNLGDVTSIDWKKVPSVDLICGGYPCQPFSTAGARRGRDDHRHLWPYLHDALRVLRPHHALMENVAGHLSMGLGDVLGDLAASGYDAEWECLPAAAVGAPHIRDRVFIVAHSDECGCDRGTGVLGTARRPQPAYGGEDVADSSEQSCDGGTDHSGGSREGAASGEDVPVPRDGAGAPRSHGGGWAAEPDVGRVAYGVPARVDRLRALGNAVVPQVAEFVGRRIMERAA